MRILTIDDSELILGMMEMIGSGLGLEIETSVTIPESFEGYDCVVVDLNLPDVEDSVATVRNAYSGKVIVLSGLSEAELGALELDVDDRWSKDIGMMGLQQKLRELANL